MLAVPLVFGMILQENAVGEFHFSEVINEIVRQDLKPKGSRSLLIVIILNENRKSRIGKILQIIKQNLAKVLLEGYLQLVISPLDAKPEAFKAMEKRNKFHEVSSVVAKTNLRASFLINYCSGIADNLIIIDSNMKPVPNALNVIYKQIDSFTHTTCEVNFSDNVSGRLYVGKCMLRFSFILYSAAFFGNLRSIAKTFGYTTISGTRIYHNSQPIFTRLRTNIANPPASITTTMKRVGDKNSSR